MVVARYNPSCRALARHPMVMAWYTFVWWGAHASKVCCQANNTHTQHLAGEGAPLWAPIHPPALGGYLW